MPIPPIAQFPSPSSSCRNLRRETWQRTLFVVAVICCLRPAAAEAPLDIGGSAALAPGPHQRLDQQFKRRLPGASASAVDRAERAFVEHLRKNASMAAEQLASGHIDEDDLSARIEIFLGDHPELSGSPVAASTGDARGRVIEALGQDGDLAPTKAERQSLADRFVVWLGGLSATARDSLLAGRMPPEELQSRIDVFAADIRAERSKVASDPAVAAVPAIEEAFEKANLGPVPDRADSICCRGTESDGTQTREFILFKKRPANIRIHIISDGLVVGVLAYDGTTAWRQVPGKPPIRLKGAETEALVASARFDDPLVGYRERGAKGRLESAPGASPIRLSIREADGEEVIETIDPVSYNEISAGRKDSSGKWDETHFREYRKVGTINVAGVQEHWNDGVLRTTTRIADVRLDTGVLAKVFSMPPTQRLDFMDYMGGLQVLAKVAAKSSASVQLPPKVDK
jgi:hypothetical protein